MSRRVAYENRLRQVRRNGVLWEFLRETAPEWRDFPRSTMVTARKWNGYRWVTVHRIHL